MKSESDFPNINVKRPEGLKEDASPFTVLIVDDSMFVRKQLHQILTSEGFNVIAEAVNGKDAIDKYKQLHPKVDVVTMDITMPEMDGIESLKGIMDFDKNARIVMISAIGNQEYVKKALLIGAKNYIVKPLNRKKVLARVLKTLGVNYEE